MRLREEYANFSSPWYGGHSVKKEEEEEEDVLFDQTKSHAVKRSQQQIIFPPHMHY